MGFAMIDEKKLAAIKFFREMNRKPKEEWDGSLEQAKRQADEFTETYGIEAMVIRRKNKYEWVSKYYFDTYKYDGKIYHTSKV